MNHYKILFYNVENLFLSLDKRLAEDLSLIGEETWQTLKASLTPNKSLQKTTLLAETIIAADPDIILMCEVGGSESLHNFNHFFLNNQYDLFYDDSNSKRGIDPGVLIKKTLGLEVNIKNFLTYKFGKNKNKFNRNVLCLETKKDNIPWINFFVVHLKSKLDQDKKDYNGLEARGNEILGLIDILKKESKSKVPFILAGDFNGNASLYNTDDEFKPLYEEQLNIKDALEIADVEIEQRVTHHYFKGNFVRGTQLDYLFLSKELWSKVIKEETKVLRYKNEYGEMIDPPQDLNQKKTYPSDHSPLLLTLKS